MFPKKKFDPYGGFDPSVFMTPGYGDGIGQGNIDISVPQDPYAGQRTDKRPGFFGKGGAWKDALGYGLDGIAQAMGMQGAYGRGKDQQAARQHEEAMLRLRGELENRTPQGVNLGDGGFGTWSPDKGLQILREPQMRGEQPTNLQRQIEYIRKLNPSMTDQQAAALAQQSMSGWQYTPEGIAASGRHAAATRAPMRPRAGAAPKLPAGFILD